MISGILETIAECIPDLTEKYIEYIFLNPQIWKTGPEKAQEDILDRSKLLCKDFSQILRTESIVNMLMLSIEIICDDGKDSMLTLQKISKILLEVATPNLTEAILSKIIAYANIYYIRHLRYYPLQLFYVMRILLEIFQSSI